MNAGDVVGVESRPRARRIRGSMLGLPEGERRLGTAGGSTVAAVADTHAPSLGGESARDVARSIRVTGYDAPRVTGHVAPPATLSSSSSSVAPPVVPSSLEARLEALRERRLAREARAFGAAASAPALTPPASTAPRGSEARAGHGRAPLTSPPPPIPMAPTSSAGLPASPVGVGVKHTAPPFSLTPSGAATAERPALSGWAAPLRRFPSATSSVSTTTFSEAQLPNRSFGAFSVRDSPPSHPMRHAPMLSHDSSPREDAVDRPTHAPEGGRRPTSADTASLPEPPPIPAAGADVYASTASSSYISPLDAPIEVTRADSSGGRRDGQPQLSPPPLLWTAHTQTPAWAAQGRTSASAQTPEAMRPRSPEEAGAISPTEVSPSTSCTPTPFRGGRADTGRSPNTSPASCHDSVAAAPPPLAVADRLFAPFAQSAAWRSGSRSLSPPTPERASEPRFDWRQYIVAGVRTFRDSAHPRRARTVATECQHRGRSASLWGAASPGAWDGQQRSVSADGDDSTCHSAGSGRPTATHPPTSSVLYPVFRATTAGSRYKLLDEDTRLPSATALADRDIIAEGLAMQQRLARLKSESARLRMEQRRRSGWAGTL
ncbi:hypothetical protein NESM_000033400 [Novymonas esmeraldas]|uniref:Uncharacterized protein n=1 Tax=Novymonas esmeraldas TaxID=1808958 RepID=A0AAW0EZN6_9TRYP